MSTIQFRVYEKSAPLVRDTLLDIFHLGNLRLSKRKPNSSKPWWQEIDPQFETIQDYYEPIDHEEVLCEYIEDEKDSDGFIVYLNRDNNPRSYAKANLWINNILTTHIELIEENGWSVVLYLGKNPQKWISKKFSDHAKRLNIEILIENGYD